MTCCGRAPVVRPRRGSAARYGAAAATMWLALGSARAQLVSDVVPTERIIPAKEKVDLDMQNARFHLGPVRLLPEFDVSNAGYNNNIFGQPRNPVGDWTASFNAGVRFIVPFGYKVYLLGDILPGYTWYANHSDLNNFTGTGGLSIDGFFNHLSFEAGGRASQSIVFYSEAPAPTLSKSARLFARTDVDLGSGFAAFIDAEGLRIRDSQEGVPLDARSGVIRFNRTDEAYSGGVRYKFGGGWTLTPEVQYTTTRFEVTPEQRNNQSVGYLLGLGYSRPRFYLDLVGGYREGDSYQGSTFPHYATPVGSYFVSYFITPWLEVRSNGERRVSYSLDVVNAYYYQMDIGGTLNIQVHPRILLKGFGLTGENKYPIPQPVGGTDLQRLDRITSYGGGVSVILTRRLTLTGLVTHRSDVSNVPSANYSLLQYSTFLSFTGEFMR